MTENKPDIEKLLADIIARLNAIIARLDRLELEHKHPSLKVLSREDHPKIWAPPRGRIEK